jgi:DNA repair exonuclease SbcCD ATPase subunit
VHQQSYQATGLPAPAAWDVPTVSEHLRRLAHLVAVRESEDERLRRLTDLRSEADACARQRDELLKQRTDLQEQLGLTIELADEWLPLLVENIGLWQRRSAEASAARQVLAELEREERTLLDRIAAQLQPFGYDRVDSAESAAQSIDSLAERQARHRRARDERADAERRIRQSIDPGLRDVAARKSCDIPATGDR